MSPPTRRQSPLQGRLLAPRGDRLEERPRALGEPVAVHSTRGPAARDRGAGDPRDAALPGPRPGGARPARDRVRPLRHAPGVAPLGPPGDHPRLRDRVPAPHSADELPAVPVRGAHFQQLPEHRHDGGDGHLRDDGRRPEHGRRLRRSPRPRLRRVLRARRLHGGLARLAARIAVRSRREADRREHRGNRCDPGARRNPHLDLGRAPRRCDRHGRGRDPHRPADVAAAWRLPRDRDARVRGDHRRGRAQRRHARRSASTSRVGRPGSIRSTLRDSAYGSPTISGFRRTTSRSPAST